MRFIFPFFLLLWVSACRHQPAASGGLSPADSLASIQVADGFQVELIAAEPLIADPIAMEIDESGRLYVAEMPGYPSDLNKTGRIKLLTDTNGDGLPDKSDVFAEGLTLPGGLMRWKKGLLVVDSPNVLYMEDTDGDNKADIRETVLTGLALSNPQHNANTPVLGLDNWIYLAHMGAITPKIDMHFTDEGSEVRFPNQPDAPKLAKNADGRNIRFKPDTRELETLSGESQYGHTFSPSGHHLCTENAHHLFHEVVAAKYLRRNPALLVPDATENIPDHGNACEVFSITQNPEHQLLTDVGVITSACGICWYQGGLFPPVWNDVVFVCEPTHNLIHADRLSDKGATFTAARVFEKKEFLASTDAWFRPVFTYIGPDGALYVVDYYRQIIEHPEWMSEAVNQSGALTNGTDKGRIYRISPKGTPRINWLNMLQIGQTGDAQLCTLIESPNIWHRRTAQRLTLDRKAVNMVPMLEQTVLHSRVAAAAVHALWTIDGLGKTDPALLRLAMKSEAPGVRENVLKIAELHLTQYPELETHLLALQTDPDPKVRFQLLLTLGNLHTAAAAAARNAVLTRDIEDPWVQIAALSAGQSAAVATFEEAIKTFGKGAETPGKKRFFENCAGLIALGKQENDSRAVLQRALQPPQTSAAWWQSAALTGLTEALQYNGYQPFGETEKMRLLACFAEKTPPALRTAAVALLGVTGMPNGGARDNSLALARKVLADTTAATAFRAAAAQLLGKADPNSLSDQLGKLLSPATPLPLQLAVLGALGPDPEGRTCALLFDHWKKLSPEVRDAAMGYLLSDDARMTKLLDALTQHRLQKGSLSWPRQVQLMNHDQPEIRNRARALLAGPETDQAAVLQQYKACTEKIGVPARGEAIYQRACASCHQISGQKGSAFGPDLATVRNRQKEFILTDILQPNRSIADGYALWTVQLKNGSSASGVVASETANSITLRDPAGKETTFPRSDVANMEASELSAMPQGLENGISVAEMADLLAFIKGR